MTEAEKRKIYVDKAVSFMNMNEGDGSFKKIIDLYNSISPLPNGYNMSYTDAWCAAFVSAVAKECGFTGFIFPECSCDRMINKYKNVGRWQENDAYIPQAGDIIMYDWDDTGIGDDKGSAEHVGIVVGVNGKQMQIIEGNLNNSVAFRFLMADSKNIRGFCLPDYASGATANEVIPANPMPSADRSVLKLGMKGYDVKELQSKLIALGYSCGAYGADGEFGQSTMAAVVKYQTQKGLEIDGEVGPMTMVSINNNIAAIMHTDISEIKPNEVITEEKIWDYLMPKLNNVFAVAGIMGNIFAESSMKANNLQDSCQRSLGHSDESYTAAVDNYTYANFVHDSAGYGLVQWTFWSRKRNLLNYARAKGVSVGDIDMQIEFMWKEISEEYAEMLSDLRNANSIKAASDMFMLVYERPHDQSSAQKNLRAEYGEGYYEKYKDRKSGKEEKPAEEQKEHGLAPKIGDVVMFTGSKQYMSSTGLIGVPCKGGKVKVVNIVVGAKHPYKLVKVADGGSNVYGWVNFGDIKEV